MRQVLWLPGEIWFTVNGGGILGTWASALTISLCQEPARQVGAFLAFAGRKAYIFSGIGENNTLNSAHALVRRVGNPALLLVVMDLLVAVLAFHLAAGLRFGFDQDKILSGLEGSLGARTLVYAFFVLLGLLSVGLYRARQRATNLENVVRVSIAMVLATLACIVTFFVFPAVFTGRGALALAVLFTALGVYWVRRTLLPAMDASGVKRRVVVLGMGYTSRKIAMLRRKSDRRRFELVGYVPANEAERVSAGQLGLGPLYPLDPVALRRLRVDEIVVALDDRRGTFPVEQLLRIKLSGIPVIDIVSFLERETGRIDLDILHPAWLLFQHSRHTEIVYRWAKRWFDLGLGVFLLLIMSPVLLAAVLAIVLEDGFRAPVFYRQARVGLHGRIFQLLKFRSMRPDAEGDGQARWASAGDNRVTRMGQWLRRFRIDELPQVINIIRGDMSLVGPRPERPEFVDQLTAAVPLYYYRHCVRPGLAGWAQLNFPYGSSVEDAREKLKYDLHYIKNAGIVLDLLILLQTAEVVLFGRGTAMAGRRRLSGPDEVQEDDTKAAETISAPPEPAAESSARRPGNAPSRDAA